MNEQNPLDWLYGTQLFGMKLGLENVRLLLAALDLPSPKQRFIHVAGTNGKGSVCAFMRSILHEGGVNAGLFTSPHLIRFNERIRDAEREITTAEIEGGISRLRELCRDWEPHPTFFELAFVLALDWFRGRGNEWVILETGLGGRLDATNALIPAVSVITPIGLDHMQQLGGTIAEIAAEKAGIIKPGIPVVSAPQEPEALAVIRETAAVKNAPLTVVDAACELPLGLAGPHQRWNAAVAVAALQAAGFSFFESIIASGLQKARWPARFQHLDDRTILDGAHNQPAAKALAEAWRQAFPGEKAAIIFGGSTGKDTAAILRELLPIARRWICCGFESPRALPPAAVRHQLEGITTASANAEIHVAGGIAEALRLAAGFPERRLFTGSLFVAGEALAHWDEAGRRVEASSQ